MLRLHAPSHHAQAPFEGGFAGRTNKLVDGCYSYWQGAILPLLTAAGYYGLEAQRAVATLRFTAEQEAAASDSLVSHLHQRLISAEDVVTKVT